MIADRHPPANPDAALLDIKGLDVAVSTDSGPSRVVQDLAMTIARGQTFALVGESGSGKSITAQALLRLLPDAARIVGGRIALSGNDLNALSEGSMRRVRGARIGIIFQEPATSLNPVMRVGRQIVEMIVAHTELRGSAAHDRAIQWLARVGIDEPRRRMQDYPFQFSGGQKQRIMIAIALAAEPMLLIADEPTTALDVTVQAQVLALLADIQKELGMAILLITHDLAIVRHHAHHVALMRAGRIVESAPSAEFFDSPRHPYARELFEAIPSFQKRGRSLSQRGKDEDAADAAAGRQAVVRQAIPAEPILRVEDLKVYYPQRSGALRRTRAWVKAVDGVSFTLHAGETLALLGESGCGKTTTGKALLRLIDDADIQGRARLDGIDLLTADRAALRKARRDIQIVFQDPYASLDPRMRIGAILQEGIASLLTGLSRSEQERRVQMLLDRVGLPADTVSRYPHEFSGGQRQRIAIARALAVEPRVLICDEPTSALDVSVQAQILDLLQQLQRDMGIAYLFITHNFSVVEYMADRVAVMDGGRIIEIGSAESVLHHPMESMTRRLLAAVPRLALPDKD